LAESAIAVKNNEITLPEDGLAVSFARSAKTAVLVITFVVA
jgi:hypothetical protein